MYSLNSSIEPSFVSLKIQLPPSQCNMVLISSRPHTYLRRCLFAADLPIAIHIQFSSLPRLLQAPSVLYCFVLIAVVMLGEEIKLWSYPLCQFIFIHLLTVTLIFKWKYSPWLSLLRHPVYILPVTWEVVYLFAPKFCGERYSVLLSLLAYV